MKRGKSSNRLIDFYLGIPLLNILASVRRKGVCPINPERIGLLFNPALGDTMLASAAAQDLRSIFPTAKLVLFAASSNLAAAKLLPEIDAIEVLPITRPLQAIRKLRKSKLDLMLDFTAWQRITALYSLMSGAGFTVGFERKTQYRHRGYDLAIPHRNDCHELDNLRRFTSALGARTHSAPLLVIPAGQVPEIVSRGCSLVVFHPWASGARSWLREWPDERWVNLAQKLSAPNQIILLSGSPADSARCKALQEKIYSRSIASEILIGQNGIAEIARVLRCSGLLVSVNTGIMHLGAILGVCTVSINGPTDPHRWGPVGPRVINVNPPDGSGGFLDLGFEYGRHTKSVMEKISVDDVLRGIEELRRKSEASNDILNVL